MKEEKRNTSILMVSFILTEILALFFANNIMISNVPVEQYQPFGNENVIQASENSGLLVVSVLVFTLFLIGIIKLGLGKIFRLIVTVFPIAVLFLYLPFQLEIVSSNILGLPSALTNFILTLAFLYALLVIISIVEGIRTVTLSAFVLMTSLIGAFLAVSISPPTLFVLPVAFALYDIYAVFRGPLKMLIKVKPVRPRKEDRDLNKRFGLLLVRIGGFTIGAGDFTFYSMLVAAAFLIKGLGAAFFVGVAINFGIVLTLKLLEKVNRPLPGLPIPIALGILTMLLV